MSKWRSSPTTTPPASTPDPGTTPRFAGVRAGARTLRPDTGSVTDPDGRGRASRPGRITLPPGAGRFVATEIFDDVEVALLADYRPTRFDA